MKQSKPRNKNKQEKWLNEWQRAARANNNDYLAALQNIKPPPGFMLVGKQAS